MIDIFVSESGSHSVIDIFRISSKSSDSSDSSKSSDSSDSSKSSDSGESSASAGQLSSYLLLNKSIPQII